MKIQILIKDFVCHFDNCEKAFVAEHELNVYLNYDTGKRPYHCRIDGCKKAFPDPNSRLCHDLRSKT
jgi:hypothetical protein